MPSPVSPVRTGSRLRTLAILVLVVASATLLVSLGTFTGFLSRGTIEQSPILLESLSPGDASIGTIPVFFANEKVKRQTTPLPFRPRAAALSALREKRAIKLLAGAPDELRPVRVETHTSNGNTVISGNANRNGSFALVYDPNGNLAWGTLYDPEKERPSTVLAPNDHGTIFLASSEPIDFDSTTEQLRTPPGLPGRFAPPEGGFNLQSSRNPMVVKVLAFYTPNAAAYLGGDVPAQAYIQSEMASANSAYLNSAIPHSVQVAGLINSSVLGYNGEGDHLNFITGNTALNALRNQYEADLVVLFSTNAVYCGIGWITAPWQTGASAYGFSDVIVESQCQGLDVAAHEMGHNEGAQHDRANSNGEGAFPYSYGYQQNDTPPYWRTIMAYACGGVNCPRIDHFSNPDVQYNGLPTGVPMDQPDSANVAFTLTQTMPYVANYRGPVTGGTPPPAPANVQASDALYPTKIHVTWTANPDAILYTVYRSNDPAMSNPLQVALSFSSSADDYSFDNTPLSPGIPYYYAVIAQNAFGTSGYSAINSGTLSMGTGTNEVKGLHASHGSGPGEINLTWQNSTVTQNKLYRSLDDVPCPPGEVIQTFSNLTPQSTVYYTNTSAGGVVPETRYYYSVGAVDAGGNETCTSLTQTGFAGTLSTPTNVQASDGTYSDRVRITWAGSPIADYYALFKSPTPSTSGIELVQQFIEGTSFEDTEVQTGQTYYYRVTASNAYTNTDFSAPDAGTTSFNAPANVQASDNTYPDQIIVTWNAVPGVTLYRVYRNTALDFAGAQDLGFVNTETYVDFQAGVNTTYYYWVIAYSGTGQTSAPSLPDGGTLTGYGSDCLAGDIDLGSGNCRARLSVIATSADGQFSKGGYTWDEVVQAPSANSIQADTSESRVGAFRSTSDHFETHRYIATFPSQGYGSKVITNMALTLFESLAPTSTTTEGNAIYAVLATPTNPTALQASDYAHIPLPPAPVSALAEKSINTIPSFGPFTLVFNSVGRAAFQTSAGTGQFSFMLVNSGTYDGFNPPVLSENTITFYTQENDLAQGYAPEMVINYHG